VRNVYEGRQGRYNGSGNDDSDSDYFSMSDHYSANEQGDDNGEPEETENVLLGVEDISEDFGNNVEALENECKRWQKSIQMVESRQG